jgi:transposase
MADSTRLYVDETTAPVLDPGKGQDEDRLSLGRLRDDRGWNGPRRPAWCSTTARA